MAANYYPAYMNYDGWVLKYLSQQREMAALVFGERPWNAAEDFRNACLFFRYHNARGARYYKGNLKGTVHSAESNRNFAYIQNDYHLIDNDIAWCI